MPQRRMLGIIAILFTMVLWGLSFLSIKISVAVIPPMTLALLRFLIASVLLYWALRHKEPRTTLATNDMPLMAVAGIIGVTAYFFFENNGVKLTTASAASLIIATIPILTIIGDFLVFKTKLTLAKIVGVVLSVGGVILIMHSSLGDTTAGSWHGNLFMLGAAFSWVIYSLATRPLNERYSKLAVVTYQTLFGTATLLPFALLEYNQWQPISNEILLHVAYLGIFCSALGYYLYVYALDVLGVSSVSLYINLIPVVSVLGGVFLLHETITSFQLLGGLVILVSVWIAELSSPEKKVAQENIA